MLVVGFPTGWGRRAGGIRSRRCGEKQLEQWVRCAVVAVLGLLLLRLEREGRSRQLGVKGWASSHGIICVFCITVDFISGCDALCFPGEE